MKKILYVEDDPDVAQAVKIILSNEGFSVTIAPNGKEGLSKLESETFDLLLLDIMLPDMSGWDIYKQIKKRDLKVAVLSVLPVTSEKRQEINKGIIRDYITKPFTKENLISRVKRILNSSDERRVQE